jgi:drug/metabolite transporter (DMT)-like permease
VKLGLTILSFLGVYIIIDPSFGNREGEAFNWWLLMPLAASVAVCINFLYLHQMSGKFKEIQVLEYTYSSQLLLSGLLMAVLGGVGSPTSPSIEASYLVMGGYLLCIVIFAYASNFLRIKTLFKRRPSEVLAFNYTGLIYSIFLDVVVFKHSLSLAQVAGALLTSAGLLSQLLLDLFKKQ